MHLSRPALVAFATTAGVRMSEAPAVAEEHSDPRGTAVVTEATVDGVDENGDGFSTGFPTGFPTGQRMLLRSSR